MVADSQPAKDQVELVPWPMSDLAAISFRFSSAPTFCSVNLPQCYWQMPLAREAQDC